jgi:signal peptidase
MYSGDLAIVQGANPQELSVGDIIVFDRANIYTNTDQSSTLVTPIAHRIQYSFSRNGTMLFGTKGDNNQAYDDWVVPDYGVVGKVTLIIPKVGYIWLFLERLDVRITIITIILFIAFAWPLISRKRKTSTSIKRKEEPNLTQNQKIHNKKDGSFLNHLVPAFLINQTP